jgi:ribosomal protein L16/L10AE
LDKNISDLPITSKAIGVRMGKGKGPVTLGARVREVMYYLKFAVNNTITALKTGGAKLPIRTKIFT